MAFFVLHDNHGNIQRHGRCPKSMVHLQARQGLNLIEVERIDDDFARRYKIESGKPVLRDTPIAKQVRTENVPEATKLNKYNSTVQSE